MTYALGVRSDFSLGESLLSAKKIPELVGNAGYKAVALVDTMTISSMISFSAAAKKEGIKSIIGCRIRVVDDPTDKQTDKKRGSPNRMVMLKVFVRNQTGIESLYRLLSKANSEEYFYKVSRVGIDDLAQALSEGGLSVSTGDFASVFQHPDYRDYMSKLIVAAGASQTFVELVPINTPLFDTLNKIAIEYAEDANLEAIVSRPMCYEHDSDADALDILGVISSGQKATVPYRSIQQVKNLSVIAYSTFVQEVVNAKERLDKHFGGSYGSRFKSALLEGNERLASQCAYEWTKQDVSLPVMAQDESKELERLIVEGWKKRLGKSQLGFKPDSANIDEYKKRMVSELKILRDMGFERYFLLVHDLVKWSKDNEIMVGPGRGSVGGSLIGYLLGITDVDPIRFGLFFERFINPDRLDLPDADLDFMSSRRHEVIEYLGKKYGEENVAGISNYGTLASASALREVARVWELEPLAYACSKLVPAIHGKSVSLEEAEKQVPEIAAYKATYPDKWEISLKLQGVMRSLGKHAAGIVVAGEPIINRAVVESRKGEPTVNWDKRVVEDQGLVKMDILGLSTLDVLAIAKNLIQKHERVDVRYDELPLDDSKVLEAFGNGETIGVFQFESPGMRNLLKQLAVGSGLTFDDISAATALYRPGPMDSGLMDDYVQVKQGFKTIIQDHPNMEAALAPTYGVVVYQEQVMQLAQDLAGMNMAGADHLRKAMGKKDKNIMAEQRQKWIDGCKSHSGLDAKKAGALFDKIELFAGYAFNKSHSVEYSIISYWAMWLKVNHPAYFYAASLSVLDEDKLSGLVRDARERDVWIYPPNINISTNIFEPRYDALNQRQALYTPFNRVKGLSDKTTAAILEAREKAGGGFVTFSDFFDTVNKTRCNKRHQSNLDAVGALAPLEFGQKEAARYSKDFPHITLSQKPAMSADRLRSQADLMPGLIIDSIKAERGMGVDKFARAKILHLAQDYRTNCRNCSLAGGVHVSPKIGSKPKIMIITDCPTWHEDSAGELMDSKSGGYVRQALKTAGLSAKDCYFTTMVKSIKQGKRLTNEQINGCIGHLQKEIEIVKPPIIVALGSAISRHLAPGIKGGFAELSGQTVHRNDLDASVVLGINPQMIYHEPSRQEMLNEVLIKAADML